MGAFDIPKGKRLNVNGFLVVKNMLILRNSARRLSDARAAAALCNSSLRQ
jgi:hypothetical protein